MFTITIIHARQILDSRGHSTIVVKVTAGKFRGRAAVPSGASTGIHEAWELRDGKKKWQGLGVEKAIENIHTTIAPLLRGVDVTNQQKIDTLMIKKDGTSNKKKLGANSILAVSLACARAAAASKRIELYQYLHLLVKPQPALSLPRCFFNIINGGKHADNELSFQEFMIAPRMKSCAEDLQAASEIYHCLRKELHTKYGKGSTNVGDEGGFAPEQFKNATQAFEMLMKAITDAGYLGKVDLAMDCAASEFYRKGKYKVDGKLLNTQQLMDYYLSLINKYPIISIEDPFHQDDFDAFAHLRRRTPAQIVGDDLTVSNVKRLQQAIKAGSISCVLLKVNQIGTLTEALETVKLAYEQGITVMVSHRSGETEDTFIADLAVAIGCGMMKAGAPCRGERTAKYNRLLRIEEMIRP